MFPENKNVSNVFLFLSFFWLIPQDIICNLIANLQLWLIYLSNEPKALGRSHFSLLFSFMEARARFQKVLKSISFEKYF